MNNKEKLAINFCFFQKLFHNQYISSFCTLTQQRTTCKLHFWTVHTVTHYQWLPSQEPSCFRVGWCPHPSSLGWWQGAWICNEGKCTLIPSFFTLLLQLKLNVQWNVFLTAGRCHLHGRAPGWWRDPLHGGAHSSSELLWAAGLPQQQAGPDAAGRYDPGGV